MVTFFTNTSESKRFALLGPLTSRRHFRAILGNRNPGPLCCRKSRPAKASESLGRSQGTQSAAVPSLGRSQGTKSGAVSRHPVNGRWADMPESPVGATEADQRPNRAASGKRQAASGQRAFGAGMLQAHTPEKATRFVGLLVPEYTPSTTSPSKTCKAAWGRVRRLPLIDGDASSARAHTCIRCHANAGTLERKNAMHSMPRENPGQRTRVTGSCHPCDRIWLPVL